MQFNTSFAKNDRKLQYKSLNNLILYSGRKYKSLNEITASCTRSDHPHILFEMQQK